MKRNNEQSNSRKVKRGHLFYRKNETLNTMETYRRSSRGKNILINEVKLA